MDVRLNTNLTAAVQTAAPVQTETAQESGAPARTPHYLSDQLFISAEGAGGGRRGREGAGP